MFIGLAKISEDKDHYAEGGFFTTMFDTPRRDVHWALTNSICT